MTEPPAPVPAPISFSIEPERPRDGVLIEPLLDRTFGPDRQSRTVYRLRKTPPARDLSFVARRPEGDLLASIRFWPILIAATPALLLGPLAVEPSLQGKGIGKALVACGLASARKLGHGICLVVGEPDYYGPFGFRPAGALGLVLPGPVEARRFQALELTPGALGGLRGLVAPLAAGPRRSRRRA